ncbi:MAG: GNAT family N-acetyltransferase [Rhodanobacteraceae bacterium]
MRLEPVTLEDDHVALEQLTLDHVSGLEMAAADGDLWNLRVTHVPKPGAMQAYVEKALAMQATGKSLPFAVRDKRDDAIAGSTRFYDFDADVPRVLIGYTWYAASRQRTYVNTACKLLLVDHALDTLGCAAVGWETDLLNTRSQQAIERLGAHRDGVLRQHKRRPDGSVRDTVSYSITSREWPEKREVLRARLFR